MARKARLQFPGAFYHVYSRGAAHQPTFITDGDRRCFLSLLADVVDRFSIEAHAYCLMDNHYHMVVRTPEGNIADAMHYLVGVYTQRFNRHHVRDGSLFNGRYNAELVETEAYLATLVPYVHMNPVEAGIVADAASYQWSSYHQYLDPQRTPTWLRVDLVLNLFGGRGRLRRATEANRGVPLELSTSDPEPMSSDNVSLEVIDAAVSRRLGCDRQSVRAANKGRPNRARDIAVHLAVELTSLSRIDVATHYGYASARSVATTVARFRRQCADDVSLSDLRAHLVTEVKSRWGQTPG